MGPGGNIAAVRPWGSNEERLVSEALAPATVPGEVLRESVRPPLPQVQLFRPIYGYERRAIGIRDIVDLDLIYPNARVDFSGRVSGYSGSSFPTLGVM